MTAELRVLLVVFLSFNYFFAFNPSLDLAITIFNRYARLGTAAVLRFSCFAIAATLVIPDNASTRRRSSSSGVQGALPTTRLISSLSAQERAQMTGRPGP
jgi:hypothetical protein